MWLAGKVAVERRVLVLVERRESGWAGASAVKRQGEGIGVLDLGFEFRSKDISDQLLRSFRSRLE